MNTAKFHDLRSWESIGKLSGFGEPKQVQGRNVHQFVKNGRIVGQFSGHEGFLEATQNLPTITVKPGSKPLLEPVPRGK
jgi:hypothetical protein